MVTAVLLDQVFSVGIASSADLILTLDRLISFACLCEVKYFQQTFASGYQFLIFYLYIFKKKTFLTFEIVFVSSLVHLYLLGPLK